MQSVVLRDESQRPWREDARVMGLVGVAHASSHFSHLLLPLMFPVFVQEFGWRYAELGMLSSLFFVISGLGQAGAGFVVDRWGARPVLLTSMALYILACLQAYAAQSYAGLMVVAVLAGLGNAPFHPVNFTILNQRVSTPRLGYAFSVHGVSGNLGWALAPVFFSVCAAWWGWRHAFLAASVLYALILVLLLIHRQHLVTIPAPAASSPSMRGRGSGQGSALGILRMPVVWWCFLFFLLSTVTLAVVQNFAVPILNALHGISLEQASMTLTAYMLLGAVGILIGGFLAARFAQVTDRVVALCMVAAALLMALCASGWLGPQATLWLLALTGFAVGIGGPSRDLMIKKGTPKEATGRVYGLVYSGLDVGFALSPLVFGLFMDQGWYTATLLGAALVLFISAGVALGVGQRSVPH
ncbi:MFS transporter [Limnohabitans sp. 2KL-3]|uniref:MFS transporter n=1 Tax=Limnohabitans sp. 2KL-3 TaxID=1100700 RepID=UPI000A825B8A|nr:MFS transporter [Limnohabitans sp. 2KL-3]